MKDLDNSLIVINPDEANEIELNPNDYRASGLAVAIGEEILKILRSSDEGAEVRVVLFNQ